MMVMTAKVDFKKWILILAAAAALLLAGILLLGGQDGSAATAVTVPVSENDSRVRFLEDFGWEVTASPIESGQVKIPSQSGEVFDRYNALQKGQGYDLSRYGGRNVMRYVYQITNYPGATEPVYATLLIYRDQVIGGDVTNTAPGGKVHGFRMPETSATETTAAG